MSGIETYTCNSCSDDFRAYTDAEAADTGYCSPACQTEGEGLV